jgi:sucrose-6-phosphate hydrolase SacC (GH32 family)
MTEELYLKVVVDRASVELFTGDGVRSISLALFPEPGLSRQLERFQK